MKIKIGAGIKTLSSKDILPKYGYMFAYMTLPESLEKINKGAVKGCNYLRAVDIPNGVKEIGELAFAYCTLLESVKLPDGVTSIGSSAFKKLFHFRNRTA